VPETCRVIINQVKQKLHLVGYLLIRLIRYPSRSRVFPCSLFTIMSVVIFTCHPSLGTKVFGRLAKTRKEQKGIKQRAEIDVILEHYHFHHP